MTTIFPTEAPQMTRKRRPLKLKDSCDMCSSSKVKCERGKPTCRRCQTLGHPCHYSVARRMGKPKRKVDSSDLPVPTTSSAGSMTSNINHVDECAPTRALWTASPDTATSVTTVHEHDIDPLHAFPVNSPSIYCHPTPSILLPDQSTSFVPDTLSYEPFAAMSTSRRNSYIAPTSRRNSYMGPTLPVDPYITMNPSRRTSFIEPTPLADLSPNQHLGIHTHHEESLSPFSVGSTPSYPAISSMPMLPEPCIVVDVLGTATPSYAPLTASPLPPAELASIEPFDFGSSVELPKLCHCSMLTARTLQEVNLALLELASTQTWIHDTRLTNVLATVDHAINNISSMRGCPCSSIA